MTTETLFYDPNSKEEVFEVFDKIEELYFDRPISILTGVAGLQMLEDYKLLKVWEKDLMHVPYFDNTLVFGLRDIKKSMFPTSSYAIYVLYGYDVEMRFLHKDEKQYIEI